MSTFYDTLHRMKITYKKEPKYKDRDEEARKQFVEYIDQIASDKLVYCDEMGVSNNITMLYSYLSTGLYSPDLNSIEHCRANFKNYLRKIII